LGDEDAARRLQPDGAALKPKLVEPAAQRVLDGQQLLRHD
jgi:hypothetical protein